MWTQFIKCANDSKKWLFQNRKSEFHPTILHYDIINSKAKNKISFWMVEINIFLSDISTHLMHNNCCIDDISFLLFHLYKTTDAFNYIPYTIKMHTCIYETSTQTKWFITYHEWNSYVIFRILHTIAYQLYQLIFFIFNSIFV